MNNLNYLPQHSRADHPVCRQRQEQHDREEILANIAFMALILWLLTAAMLPYLCSQI